MSDDKPKKTFKIKSKDKTKGSKSKPIEGSEGQVIVIPYEEYKKLNEALATQAQLLAIATNMNIELTKKLASFSPSADQIAAGAAAPVLVLPAALSTPTKPTRVSPPQPTDYVVSLTLKMESHSSTPSNDDWFTLMSTKGIMHHTINIGWSKLGDEQFLQIPQFCINLKTLVIPNCDGASDSFIKALATNCPKLKVLDIRFCKNVTSYSLKTCAKGFPKLKQLQIDHMENIQRKELEGFFNAKPDLNFFSACSAKGNNTGSGNTHLRDDYAGGYSALANCRKMERLFLEQCGISNVTMCQIFPVIGASLLELRIPNNKVSDATLDVISNHCVKLEVLDIGHAYEVNAPGLLSLSKIQTLQELIVHYMKHDNAEDARQCFSILTRFPNLNSLNVQGWQYITVEQLYGYLSSMPKMEKICTASSSFTLKGDMVYGQYTNVPNWLKTYKPQQGG